MTVRKIAILHTGTVARDEDAAHRIRISSERLGIAAEVFEKGEDIPDFAPDMVIALSAQDPKLTGAPTYGLIDSPVVQYERAIRFVRNVMTYDAWLTPSRELRLWIDDMAFGAHKQGRHVAFFARTAQMTEFVTRIAADSMIAVFIDGQVERSFQSVITKLSHTRYLKAYGDLQHCRAIDSQAYFGVVEPDGESMIERYRNGGIALVLSDVAQRNSQLPPEELFQAIASGSIVICTRSPWIEDAFGDSVLYVDGDQSAGPLAAEILERMQWVRDNPELSKRKAFDAHSLLQKHYVGERLLMNIFEMHETVLVEKGYRAAPGEAFVKLPRVSYIMRTGGGGSRPMSYIRRALDSLVAQRYPKLTVIFVLHAPFPALEELMKEYPALDHKYVRSFGSMRSTAIIRGVQAVEEGLFGLLDDDDEFHPNHVRMLIRTLAYHDSRDRRGRIAVAYASSIEVTSKGHRDEKPEWLDQYMLVREQRRCIEHFRWYQSSAMAEYRFFLMSNSWLAHKDIVNADVLADPLIDTCEDLYFCLQLAQRSDFAFSCEVTAIHHFHGAGHSTVLDSGKHWPDTTRMARRAWQRVFPAEQVYRNPGIQLIRRAIEGEISLGSSCLDRMSMRAEGEKRGDIVHFGKFAPTGIALFGPYVKLLPGRYILAVFMEYADLDADALAGFKVDVVCDDGRREIAVVDIKASRLRRLGRFLRLDLPFVVTQELADYKLEFRVWRQAPITVDIVRLVVNRHGDAADDVQDLQDAEDEASLQGTGGAVKVAGAAYRASSRFVAAAREALRRVQL
jgi:hypothetical protein